MNRWRIIAMAFVSLCMLLSDCMSLFGAWSYNLKYVGLVCLIVSSVACSGQHKTRKERLALAMIGVSVLVIESLFQERTGVSARAVGLFAGLGLIICFSSSLIESRQSLLIIGIATAFAVTLLLLLSWQDCLAQWRFYVSIGRPRLRGCFSNPNSLGAISSVVLIELTCGQAKTRLENHLKAFLYFTMLATLILSGSRTSMLMMVGFYAMLAYQRNKALATDYRARVLLLMAVLSVALISLWNLSQSLTGDVTVAARLNSLFRIDFATDHSLFGFGYVSSENISILTEEAGGAVEMLWVSLFYRVGIMGILAYILLFIATSYGNGCGLKAYYIALVFSVLIQSLGESYLSSIMSFPSCFIWVLLSSLPMLVVTSSETDDDNWHWLQQTERRIA